MLVTNYGSGRRKDVVKQCLEFARKRCCCHARSLENSSTDWFWVSHAHSTTQVISGPDASHQITSWSPIHCSSNTLLYVGRGLERYGAEWTGKADIRRRKPWQWAKCAYKAIFCSENEFLYVWTRSRGRTLISVSAVPIYAWRWTQK